MKRLLLLILFLLLPAIGWGGTLTNPASWRYQKKITLAGTGSDETNYVLKLNLHYGSLQGDVSSSDTFFNNHCKTDFSDLRFTDANGNVLKHYLAGTGNYEIIYDNNNVGRQNFITSGGTIYATRVEGLAVGNFAKSIDNGATWTTLNTNGDTLRFVDSRGYIYLANGNNLYRSTDDGVSRTSVLDMTTSSGIVDAYSVAEDSSGNLYAGRYQDAFNPAIYKSTAAQAGGSWTEILGYTTAPAWQANHTYAVGDILRPTTANDHLYYVASCTGTCKSGGSEPVAWTTTQGGTTTDNEITWRESYFQHIHSVTVDSSNDYIYAGIDAYGQYQALIRSTDEGSAWKVVKAGEGFDARSVFIADDGSWAVVGSGTQGNTTGKSIQRTTDWATFTPVLTTGYSIQGIHRVNGNLYALGVTYNRRNFAQIFRSADDGVTWMSVWIGPYDTGLSFQGYDNITVGTPTGGEAQALIGSNDGAISYSNARVYDGGTHYQGTAYVTIPNLPADGADIYVYYGKASATSTSDVTAFTDISTSSDNLVGIWKFNEGTGTNIADSSGNALTGTLTHSSGKGSWNATDGRRSGDWSPYIQQAGASYNFNNGDYVSIPHDASLAAVKNMTALAWVRTADKTSSNRYILCKGTYTNPTWRMTWSLRQYNDGLIFMHYDGSADRTVSYYSSPISDNQWHLVGFILSNETPPKVSFIIDTLISSPSSVTSDPVTNTDSVTIGIRGSISYGYVGDIDDVQIYDTALTSDQIRQIYENRKMIGASEAYIDSESDTRKSVGGGLGMGIIYGF
jgi:hypothetical protein